MAVHTTTIEARRRQQVKVEGKELIRILNTTQDLRIPADAEVFIRVPGGGDWSSCNLDVDDRNPITIEWTEVTKS